jgi:hypothetical protein
MTTTKTSAVQSISNKNHSAHRTIVVFRSICPRLNKLQQILASIFFKLAYFGKLIPSKKS